MTKKHNWNSWENYLNVHERTLREYLRRYYVRGPQNYEITKVTDQNVQLTLKGLVLRTFQGNDIEFKIESGKSDSCFGRRTPPRKRYF